MYRLRRKLPRPSSAIHAHIRRLFRPREVRLFGSPGRLYLRMAGKSLVGDFEGQTRAIFASIEKTLAQHQGKLSDIVRMTVYITDARYGDKFVEIRREIFKQNFPASTLVTVSGLAHPALLIEITPVAVVGSK